MLIVTSWLCRMFENCRVKLYGLLFCFLCVVVCVVKYVCVLFAMCCVMLYEVVLCLFVFACAL